MTFDPALATAGDIAKCRSDLQDALVGLRLAWKLDGDDRAVQATYGLEALMRAVSTLTAVVERVDEQQRTDRKRIGHLNGRVNAAELVS